MGASPNGMSGSSHRSVPRNGSGDWAAISYFGEKGEKVFGVISKPNTK
jgi:hypothetical protein